MLLSILSTLFSNYALTDGEDFLIVLTSWSLCFPEYSPIYRGWCILDICTRTCNQSRSKEFLHRGATRRFYCLKSRSLVLNFGWLVHMKNILALAAYRKFFPWAFPQLQGSGISGQLFLSDRRELLVRHMIEQLVIC